MVHTGIFATSAECLAKAGKYYNSTDVNEAMINAFCLQAEGYINSVTRYNWSDAYASLNADVKGILSLAEAAMVGNMMINYDMSGYPLVLIATKQLDVNRDMFVKAMEYLESDAVRKMVVGA